MRTILPTTLLIATFAAPVATWGQTSEGRELAKLAFQSVDQSERGFIDQGEFFTFGGDIFVSMDHDENDMLSLGEFLGWGFGLEQVADEAGRAEAYETAMRVVFSFWDRNGNGEVSKKEYRQSMAADFRRADTDNDALLTEEEFLVGYSVNVAARAAINPPRAQ